jgi:cell division protein FtsQ
VSKVVRAERRFASRRPLARSSRRGIAVAAVVTTLGALFWLGWASPVLRLDRVRVEGITVDPTSRLTAQEVAAAARAPFGHSLLDVSLATIRARVARLPAIASVQVHRLWPHAIAIDVTVRRPVARVAGPGGVTLIDASGTPYLTVPSVPVGAPPLLDISTPAPVAAGAPPGDRAVAAVRAALLIWQQLPRSMRGLVLSMTAASPDAVSMQIQVTARRSATVVWGSPSQTAAKLAALRPLLGQPARQYDVSTPSIAVVSH